MGGCSLLFTLWIMPSEDLRIGKHQSQLEALAMSGYNHPSPSSALRSKMGPSCVQVNFIGQQQSWVLELATCHRG